MLFWTMIALMTAAATLAVLEPLMRRTPVASAVGSDLAIYRDQLAELDRDQARGLIGEAEAVAARTEIARRLIAADARPETAVRAKSLARPVAVALVVVVPAIALAGYLSLGRPDLADAPLATRLAEKPADSDIDAMVARVEKHLETHPEDLSGWRVLAPIYMRSGRYADAADAYGRVVDGGEPDAETLEAYGLALVAEAGGVASAKAEAVFAALVKAHPDRASARFYYAEALRQSGEAKPALDEIEAAFRLSPADAPWLETLRGKRAELLAALKLPPDTPEPATLPAVGAPGPTADEMAAGAALGDAERAAMVSGMVERLAERLANDPNDKDGWLRLIRSYKVLGDDKSAADAADKARAAFKDDVTALAEIDAAATEPARQP
jgi:cytochrome c-type biogenesis protein CcmH